MAVGGKSELILEDLGIRQQVVFFQGMDGTLYRKHTGYYTYLKNPGIRFTKNVK